MQRSKMQFQLTKMRKAIFFGSFPVSKSFIGKGSRSENVIFNNFPVPLGLRHIFNPVPELPDPDMSNLCQRKNTLHKHTFIVRINNIFERTTRQHHKLAYSHRTCGELLSKLSVKNLKILSVSLSSVSEVEGTCLNA
jgi:hypothetical protein